MLKQKIIFTLCLFLSAIAFFSCGDVAVPLENDEIEITDFYFVKVKSPHRVALVTEQPVDEYRVGDTMAIVCTITNMWIFDVYSPPKPPIVGRVLSQETGDVQTMTFLVQWLFMTVSTPDRVCTAYISPFKTDISGNLLPDPTKKQLKISPKGDVLTVQVNYKNQIITKKIKVKGN